ncbi:MAG: Smr/MutS family protein [Spirochaetales bacterium]|nr:Smr/MutS family protein [Spirochaetales bacterium]
MRGASKNVNFKDLLDQWEKSENGKKISEQHERQSKFRDSESEHNVIQNKPLLSELKRMKPQDELDLHGFTSVEAEKLVIEFLENSAAKGFHKVQIIHGKGNHSENRESVLKKVVRKCIDASPYGGMSGTPPRAEGGSGAVWVAIKKKRHRN